MPIKFPRLHIATSVVNRILNIRDELGGAPDAPQPPAEPLEPVLPDTTIPSAVLDVRTNEPVPEDVPELDAPEPQADELGAMLARGDNLIS